MLITRLLTWYKRRHNLHVFLLEIVAIFIGISASLIVDDWRETRQNTERLNHLLEEIHFSLILDRANNRAEFLLNMAAIDSGLILAYGDPEAISDDELLRHFVIAAPPPPRITLPLGYNRLSASGFTIPFDRMLASIDGEFRELESAIAAYNSSGAQIRDLIARAQRAASRPADIRRVGLDGLSIAASRQLTELFDVLGNNPGYNRDLDDAGTTRRALQDPAVRAILVELISRRTDAGVRLIQMSSRINSIIATIRYYVPDITLPVESIGIDGTATGLGWSESDSAETASKTVPLERSSENPNLWATTVDLVDGELKFRADDSWVINWGVPRASRNLIGTGAQFEFGGDPDEFFPSGTAEIRGINIPIRAGRYRVSFDSRTFAYHFEALPN